MFRKHTPHSTPRSLARTLMLLALAALALAGTPRDSAAASWPSAKGEQKVSATIKVSGSYDGGLKRFIGTGALGSGSQSESLPPMFELADGATLQNVILGNPAADGVHCKGSCTLKNVWWEDVGEDAATFKGSSASQTMTIDGGGARKASDKVFQHNGPGTMVIKNFQVEDFGKLYRSCGNCKTQYKRSVVIQNVTVTAPAKSLVGINENYGDTARISGVTIYGDSSKKIVICQRYIGNNTGKEPTSSGKGPDSTYCLYSTSNITYK